MTTETTKSRRPNRRVSGAWGMEVRGHIAVWLFSMTATVAVLTTVAGPVTVRPAAVAIIGAVHGIFGLAIRSVSARTADFAFCGAWILGSASVLLFLFAGLDGHAFSPAAAYTSAAVASVLVAATTIQERLFWRRIRVGLGRE